MSTPRLLLALDPGTEHTGYVLLQKQPFAILDHGDLANLDILSLIVPERTVACEMVAHYGSGMPAGKEIFDTCVWIGRFCQKAVSVGCDFHRVYRQDVKLHLCHSCKAKDANIRQALIDKLGPQGRKKQPGPTFGIAGHVWAALAVGVTFLGTKANVSVAPNSSTCNVTVGT